MAVKNESMHLKLKFLNACMKVESKFWKISKCY